MSSYGRTPFACRSCELPSSAQIPVPSQTVYSSFPTSRIPTAIEVNEVRHLLSSLQSQAEAVDAALNRLKTAIDEVSEKRALIQKTIDGHRAIIAPERLLPPEILSHIFNLCKTVRSSVREQPLRTEVTIAQVCQRWRAIIVGMPRLWSHLHIHASPVLSTVGSPASLTNVWLPRSGNRPLNIDFYMGNGIPSLARGDELFTRILSVLPRWRRVCLNLSDDQYERLWGDGPVSSDSLESLEITLVEHPEDVEDLTPMVFNGPRIRRVRVDSIPISLCYFPWSQLVELGFKISDWDNYEDVIPLCTALTIHAVSFEIDFDDDDDDDRDVDGFSREIELPNVTNLEVHFLAWELEPYGYLSRVFVPKLEHLILDCDEQQQWDIEDLPGYFDHCQRPLRSVTLRGGTFDVDELLHCLHDLPMLEALNLELIDATPALSTLINHLRAPHPGQDVPLATILPRMHTFGLRLPYRATEGDLDLEESIINFVRSRMEVPINSEAQPPPPSSDAATTARLQTLKLNGPVMVMNASLGYLCDLAPKWMDLGLDVEITKFD